MADVRITIRSDMASTGPPARLVARYRRYLSHVLRGHGVYYGNDLWCFSSQLSDEELTKLGFVHRDKIKGMPQGDDVWIRPGKKAEWLLDKELVYTRPNYRLAKALNRMGSDDDGEAG